jgi:hypothetical protein
VQLSDSAKRSHIVVTDKSSRSRVAVHKEIDGGAGALTLAIAMNHKFWHKHEPSAFQCLAISREAFRVRLIAVAIAEVRNSLMAQLDQVIRYIRTGLDVLDQY